MTSIRKFTTLVASSAAMVSGSAFAETRVGADVSVSAGYATNPFSAASGDAGSATVSAAIAPFIALLSPSGETRISGEVRRTEYLRRYDGQMDYMAGLSSRQQLGTRTTLSGNVSYISRVINALNPIGSPLNPLPNDPNAPIIFDPVTSGTFAQRTKMLSGGFQLSQQVSARDTVTLSGNATMARFGNTSLVQSDYDSYGGGIGYQRTISANTSVGLNMGASRTKYKNAAFGNTTSLSPTVTLVTKLSPRLTLSADAGVTFTDTDVAGGNSRKFNALSGRVSLCNSGERSNLCLDASRSIAPSAFNGVSKQTAAGLSYSYSLDERSQVTAGVSYARQTGVAGISRMHDIDYGQASLGYNRQVSRRLSAFATVSYADSFNSIAARRANFYGSVGLRYRLGDIR